MSDPTPPGREPLRALMQHHAWANRRILDACQQLSAEGLDAAAPGTFGTIRATLAHLADSERGYLRLLGVSADDLPGGPAEQMELGELGALLAQTGELLVGVAERGALAGDRPVVAYGSTWQVPAALLLAQAVNHATEHRTNITTILAGLGADAPETSPWMYFVELSGAGPS